VLVGADLAIVFLMTNKPGWTGAVIAGAIGLALGAVAGVLANRTRGARTPDLPLPRHRRRPPERLPLAKSSQVA
jgi:hypothetical protein